jgi:hypothetical protein
VKVERGLIKVGRVKLRQRVESLPPASKRSQERLFVFGQAGLIVVVDR